MIKLYTKFHFIMCNLSEENKWKRKILQFFYKSKGHNSIKNCLIIPKIELDIDIIMVNLHVCQISFQYMYNLYEENEQ